MATARKTARKPQTKAQKAESERLLKSALGKKPTDIRKDPLVRMFADGDGLSLTPPPAGGYTRLRLGKRTLCYIVPAREGVAVHPSGGVKLPGANPRGHVKVTTVAQAAKIRDLLVKKASAS